MTSADNVPPRMPQRPARPPARRGALGPTIVWNEMAVGLAYNVGVFVVLVGIAVLRFERKDILS